MAAIREDLPALGKPMRPMSATVLSSRVSSRSSPGSPLSANPGALRFCDARAALPRPPRPPAAATNRVPVPTRSARISPSLPSTTVPLWTLTTWSWPAPPFLFEPSPWWPLPALRTGRRWKSSSVDVEASTSRITLPPRPPLPPSGPPSGLNFSRCTDAQPWPPWPACTRSTAWSANSAMSSSPQKVCASGKHQWRAGNPGPPSTCRFLRLLGRDLLPLGQRNNVDRAAAAEAGELNPARHQREQRVIAAAADTETGVEVRAALPDDDLARVDPLAAEALHAKPLRVAVPAVTAGRRALLVCHLCLPSCPYRFFSLVLSLGDAGDPDLGVLLPVTLAALVPGL